MGWLDFDSVTEQKHLLLVDLAVVHGHVSLHYGSAMNMEFHFHCTVICKVAGQ